MRSLLLALLLVPAFVAKATPMAYFNYHIFYTPDQKPYLVTSLQFSAGSFKYRNNGDGLKATAEITQIFRSGDSIVFVDKYRLNSPVALDSVVEDFYDVQRYGLAPGIYNYELTILDVITGESVEGAQPIEILPFSEDRVSISDVQFIEAAYKSPEQSNFVKNGYFMLPYMTNYFPPDISKIAFYFEVYNAEKIIGSGQRYLVSYAVSDYAKNNVVKGIFDFQGQPVQPVTPVLAYLSIEDLPSGEYDLVISVVNTQNDTLLTETVYFQRRNITEQIDLTAMDQAKIDLYFNHAVPHDSIPYYLGSLMPISPGFEYETIRNMLKGTDTTMMERYFYAFWLKTAPEDPFAAWVNYKSQVYYCEKMFGTQIKAGYETDRGRVYLKYGAPDAVMDRPNEPSAYPYQIWQYYRIGQRSNQRFVFYNPDLVTNDYPLLHSTMQGELQNYRWEHDLHKRDSPFTNIDDPNDGNMLHYGGNVKTYYINP